MNITGLEEFLSAASRHRFVLLGECSHDMNEFYEIKTTIVRRLVEEHGYSLLILEAGMASCAQSMSGPAEHPVDRLEGLYRFYRTAAMLSLIELWQRPDINGRLSIVGMDPRVLSTGAEWIVATLSALSFHDAARVGECEAALGALWREMIFAGVDEATAKHDEWERRAQDVRGLLVQVLEWLAGLGGEALDARLAERILHDRLTMLDVLDSDKRYYQWRDRRMAANVEWWCRSVHPDAKAIIWGHNFHTMRRRSLVDQDVSMGECLEPAIVANSFNLGVYAHSGIAASYDRSPITIAPAPEGSLEHIGIEAGDAARITIFPDGDGWWRRPCLTRSFGIEEETLVPAEQYDAVLVVRDVRPQQFVDHELIRRMPA